MTSRNCVTFFFQTNCWHCEKTHYLPSSEGTLTSTLTCVFFCLPLLGGILSVVLNCSLPVCFLRCTGCGCSISSRKRFGRDTARSKQNGGTRREKIRVKVNILHNWHSGWSVSLCGLRFSIQKHKYVTMGTCFRSVLSLTSFIVLCH